MSKGSNRARAKLAAKRRGQAGRARSHAKRPTPGTAPYAAAAALTDGDIGDLQRAIATAPGADVLAELDAAAGEIERPQRVTLQGTCSECGSGVSVTDTVSIPAMAAVAGRLGDLRDRLSRFDGRVLQRMIDRLGEGASLWFTGGKK